MSQTQVEIFRDGSIVTDDLSDSAVTTEKIANLSIVSEKIADGTIKQEKLSSDVSFNPPFTTRGFNIPI